jgi:hypothetical protein
MTGIAGLVVASQQRGEERRIVVRIVARGNGRDYSNEGFGLRVTLVNESLRGLTIVGARLYIDGKRIGTADGFLADPRVLDRQLLYPGAVSDERRELPLGLAPRAERSIALLFPDVYDNFPLTGDPKALPPSRQQRRLLAFSSFVHDTRDNARVSLSLDLAPGGRRVIRVAQLVGMTPKFQWQVSLDGPGKRVTSISIRRKLGAEGQTSSAVLDLWGDTPPRTHRRISRVIVGADWTRFPFGRLPDGRYLYAFLIDGTPVAGGRFRTPDRCARPGYHPDLTSEDLYTPYRRPRPCAAR